MEKLDAEKIGPLTAAEWCEFRLQEDDDEELLSCCGNTSEIRTDIFQLLRMGGERNLLNNRLFADIWEAINHHGMPGGRGSELLNRMHDYYMKGK